MTKLSYNTKRWLLQHYRNTVHALAYSKQPRVLCNSFQKSGTHLLLNIVRALPNQHYYKGRVYWHYMGRSTVELEDTPQKAQVLKKLDQCRRGEIFRGHLGYDQALEHKLNQRGFKHLLIYRDPRDVVVSLLHWWKKYHEQVDIWPYRYFHALSTDKERLSFLIEGWPASPKLLGFPKQVEFPHIGKRFDEYLPWLNNNTNVLPVRYEDLVSQQNMEPTLQRILTYLYPDLSASQHAACIAKMQKGMAPAQSSTFRKGTIGEWQHYLNEQQHEMVWQLAGHVMQRLGYAQAVHHTA